MIKSLEVQCRPVENELIPHSTGHLLYSGILNSIRRHSPETSEKIHCSENARVSISPLRGEFRRKDRNRKQVFDDTDYRFFLNIIDTGDAFQPLFRDLILDGEKIKIGDGTLEVRSLSSEERNWDDFIVEDTPRELFFHFMSPACIKYRDSGVTEMFPHREAVFKALENSWNRNAPEDYRFKIETEKLKRQVFEKVFDHDTANTVVTRKDVESGKHQIKEFGFTGKTIYGFKDADTSLKHKLAILTHYAKYAGLGSHTARGLGNVFTEVKE